MYCNRVLTTMEFTMKWFLFLIGLALVVSCAETNRELTSDGSAERLEALNTVAMDLAADPSWLTPKTLEQLKSGPVRLLEVLAKNSGNLSPWTDEEVMIELYANSIVLGLAKSPVVASYYVGLDPDVFHFPENVDEEAGGLPVLDMPAYHFENDSVFETTVQLDPENPTDNVIFFVSLMPAPSGRLAKSNTIPGTYMALRQITLKHKHDESAEEFEVYFSSGPDPIINYINGTTTHVFNGQTWNDAAGNSRTYMDINNLATYATVDGQEIALVRVDNLAVSSVRMVAIEADWNSGSYVMGRYNRNQQAGTTSTIATDYYDMASNTRMLQENTAYRVDLQTSLNDDRYQLGGIKSINWDNLDFLTGHGAQYINTATAIGGPLIHMDWVIAKKVY